MIINERGREPGVKKRRNRSRKGIKVDELLNQESLSPGFTILIFYGTSDAING
jgi:hypothetical protein